MNYITIKLALKKQIFQNENKKTSKGVLFLGNEV